MKSSSLILISLLSLLLLSCGGKVDPKEDVIQKEVSLRVETIRQELQTDQDRRSTLRVVALCLLAGVSAIMLFRLDDRGSWFSSRENPGAAPLLPDSRRDPPLPGRRVIEQPGPDPPRQRNP